MPGGPLLGWLTIVGTLVALVLLARSEEPLTLKLVAVGLAAFGVCLIVVYYLGRWHERLQLARRIKMLERERDHRGRDPGLPR